ncbi:hypothetical protein N657DRAFT_647726 [Parathielavia appendiculata]|uniref:Uncharacterized protein n=1 Tax=Parathielavia appendiculata TaxID=2587402 RepID=A0AAN6Z2F8_9PEZI|nr:hypothetical protein N657DRAFT_647726 [Parathielavia appendiculata]
MYGAEIELFIKARITYITKPDEFFLAFKAAVTVSGSILQLADDDSTSTLNLGEERRDVRLW